MNNEPKNGDLRVWHNPQVSRCESFYVKVGSVAEAVLVMKALANYDLFQFENKVKGDYANVQGLEVFYDHDVKNGGDGWESWYDEEFDMEDPEEYLDIQARLADTN